MTDRESALYLERARVHVEGDRVVYYIADDAQCREYNIPHVNLAVLFLGQGTSITADAMRLLGEEGVHVAVTGTGGTPIHMGALTVYKSTRHFRQLLPIYLDPSKSLAAAKIVMRDRAAAMRKTGVGLSRQYLKQRDTSGIERMAAAFERELQKASSIDQLLGLEGNFAKQCYAEFARMSGVSKAKPFRRMAGGRASPSGARGGDAMSIINALIDHGNYLAYGIAGAALWALGVPPHLSLFHGKTREGGLVFDLADVFKDSIVLPLAFASVHTPPSEDVDKLFRQRMIDAFDAQRTLSRAVSTVESVIASDQGGVASDA